MCNGHAREPSGEVSGSEDVFGHCDDQGVLRRSSQITNDQISANERPGNGHHFRNKKAANYDGISSWQDFLVHFEMVCEINGWDDITKALELATSLRGSAQAVLSDLRPDLRRSYVHLVAALTSRFQPSNQAELYRAPMKNKSRGKTVVTRVSTRYQTADKACIPYCSNGGERTIITRLFYGFAE